MTLRQLSELYPYFGALIVLVALLRYRAVIGSPVATLPLYIIVITLLNLYAAGLVAKKSPTKHLFNCVIIPLEFVYFFGLYFLFSKKGTARILVSVLSLFYAITYIIDLIFFEKEYTHLYQRSYTAGALSLFVLALAFYYELLNSERLFKFYQVPGFWVSTGLLIFYAGTLPFHLAWNYTADSFLKAFYTNKFNFYILMYLMYGCFLTSITCLKWKKK